MVFSASGTGVLNPTTVKIANVASSSATAANNITVMFSADPKIAAGDVIKVSGIGVDFDGTVTVGVGNTTTITYTSPTAQANITTLTTNSALVTNTRARIQVISAVTESHPAPVAVTSLTDTVAGESYNVPGSLTYNADNAIDNIIIANETGTTSANPA
jgi:hypothetical protein